jgi:hypothetical protein
MTVVRLTGNTLTLNSASTVVPLANNYNANSSQGASSVYIWNSNTTSAVLVLANSQGSFTFTVPGSSVLILNKVPSDTIACSSNSTNGYLICNPIQKCPD